MLISRLLLSLNYLYSFPHGVPRARFVTVADVKRARLSGGGIVDIIAKPLKASDNPSYRFAGFRAPKPMENPRPPRGALAARWPRPSATAGAAGAAGSD